MQVYGTLALSGFGIEAVSSATAAKEEMMGANSASMAYQRGGWALCCQAGIVAGMCHDFYWATASPKLVDGAWRLASAAELPPKS